MRALQFQLSGETGFFKKPDVNAYAYFTYNNIHKVALLGLLGAVAGLGGYNSQNMQSQRKSEAREVVFPEFYEKLQSLKVAIQPQGDKGYFPKKIQQFNNSVGYASMEQGGNLIVREQWLEKPEWRIWLLDDGSVEGELFTRLWNSILSGQCVYMPYLGKNDHPALISDGQEVQVESVEEVTRIHSLFALDGIKLGSSPRFGEGKSFMYREFMPCSLNRECNAYEFRELCFTNHRIKALEREGCFYCCDEEVLEFL